MTTPFLIPCLVISWALAVAVVLGIAALVVSQIRVIRDEWRTHRPEIVCHKALSFCVPHLGLHVTDCQFAREIFSCRPDPDTKPKPMSGLPPAPALPMDRITSL